MVDLVNGEVRAHTFTNKIISLSLHRLSVDCVFHIKMHTRTLASCIVSLREMRRTCAIQ